jgi:probable F420-dependent oxidoreductase
MTERYGITVPLSGRPFAAQREWIEELEDLGYTDVWTAETDAYDALTPIALASQWTSKLRFGTAIVPVYTHGPAQLASQTASVAEAAPGRVVLGIGSSSNVIVERWNGITFEKPYQRVRDTIRFLRAAMTGEKVVAEYETFAINGFRLGLVPKQPVPIMVAALRPGMLRLAGREGDGAIINWLSPDDVTRVAGIVNAQGEDKELVARIFVCPSEQTEQVRAAGRFAVAAYLNVPVYAAFHDWLGRGPALQGMWDAWKAGDRKAALAAIPDEVVDDLIVHGSPEQCRATIQRYFDNGVTTSSLALLPLDPSLDHWESVRALAPHAG